MKKLPATLFQLFILAVFRLYYFGRVKTNIIDGSMSDRPVVIASNHARKLDPFIIACFLPLRTVLRIFPYSFMTANIYYYQWWRPLAGLAGCFPAKPHKANEATAKYGVGAAVKMLSAGYSLVMFPEGKRTTKPIKAKHGISSILRQSDTPLILCYISWHRTGFSQRINLNLKEASDDIDRSDPAAIMRAIYSLAPQ